MCCRWPAGLLAFLALLTALGAGCGAARGSGVDAGDTTARAARLRRRLPPHFTVVTVAPFVVVGDDPPEDVELLAVEVVGRATRALLRQHFDRLPRRVHTIWMFSSAWSYESNADAYLGRPPISPYGYFSPLQRAIVVNTTLGAGTLIHELTHVLLDADFPGAPVWFDEGLASLYEATHYEGERLVGDVNWRLPPLQQALEDGDGPTLEAVMKSSRRSLSQGRDGALRYAAARYVCYLLQERGLLSRYLREFRAARASDPKGIATLERVLGADLPSIEREWRAFVLGLAWPVVSREWP